MVMGHAQAGILAPIPRLARYLTFVIVPGADIRPALTALTDVVDGEETVLGVGRSTVQALGREIKGLKPFPSFTGPGFDVPSTPAALWLWLRGDDRGELVHRSRRIQQVLAPAFQLSQTIDAFQYGASRDLTGYEDGTENPQGDAAVAAAIVCDKGPGLDGGSFVAVQQWLHDLDRFSALAPAEQDNTFGRRKTDNEEIEDAPPSAHVKRTAQESFEPAAFVLRRSMPWAEAQRAGLVFVAFGHSVDAFAAQLRRMVGAEDGIPDALFGFTRPMTGGYYWCPPVANGRVDLRALGF